MTLMDKIAILCGKRKIPLRQLEREAGLSPRTIQHWDKSTPSADKVARVARVLEVPVEELLSVYDESLLRVSKVVTEYKDTLELPLPENEQGILFTFRLLNDEGQDRLAEYAKMLSDNNKYLRYPKNADFSDEP